MRFALKLSQHGGRTACSGSVPTARLSRLLVSSSFKFHTQEKGHVTKKLLCTGEFTVHRYSYPGKYPESVNVHVFRMGGGGGAEIAAI